MRSKGANPDAGVALLAARQHGVVTTHQLAGLGLDRAAIRRRVVAGRLHGLHRGVYAVGHAALAFEGRCLAAVLAVDPTAVSGDRGAKHPEGAVLSHRSAAELWGFMQRAIGPIHVTSMADGGRKKRQGLIVHRSRTLGPGSTAFIAGVPLTTPSRTLADLRGGLPQDLHQRATRRALDLRLVTAEDLGPTPDLTRSELERAFLALCRRHRLPQPLVNSRVGPYEVDFLWPDECLIVETDGFTYHRSRAAFERDRLETQSYRRVATGWSALPIARCGTRRELLPGRSGGCSAAACWPRRIVVWP